MLAPLRSNASRRQTHGAVTLEPPIMGLNTRDDITKLGPGEAWRLDNVVVTEGGIELRKGHTSHATGLGDAVDTLMVYAEPDGTETLFAATTTAIYDVSAGGAVGAAVVSGLTNGNWDSVNFTTTGGSYLVICNGADAVRNWDGSSWTTPTITGLTSTTAVQVHVHMQRIWLTQVNTLDCWYLAAGAISGAATKLPLGQVFRGGGYLMAVGSWTRDGADGMDDLFVAITNKGELAVYSGTDPSSASTWELVGVTRVPEPLGRRCLRNVGGDCAILTKRGVISLAGVLGLAYSGQQKAAITDKVRTDIVEMAVSSPDARGWQLLESPADGLLVINGTVTDGSTYRQFIMNTGTKAWARWTGLNGRSWAYFMGSLYYGDDAGTVWQMEGEEDNGEAIDAVIAPGFSNLGTQRTKQIRRVRPHMSGPPGYKPRIVVRTDYNTEAITETAATYSTAGPVWDEATWDVASWGSANGVIQFWQASRGSGFVVSPVVLLSSLQRIKWHGVRIAFEIGDNL